MQKVLRLLAQDTRLCLPLSCVNKILPLMMLEQVPESPHFVIGLMNLAGRSIPVIDLSVRLGLKRKKTYTLDTPLIHCSKGSDELVFLVDRVIGLAELDSHALQKAGRFTDEQSPYLGSIVFEKEVFLFLNLGPVFDLNTSLHVKTTQTEVAHE